MTIDDGDSEVKNKIELEGLVTAGACGSFTVRNVVVTTDAATVFKNGRCEEIAVGAPGFTSAQRQRARTALAMLVNIQRDADDNGKSGDNGNDDGNGNSGWSEIAEETVRARTNSAQLTRFTLQGRFRGPFLLRRLCRRA